MGKILYIAHIGATKDGRTSRLLKTMKTMAEVYYLAPDSDETDDHNFKLDKMFCLSLANKLVRYYKIEIIFADNRMSCIEALYLKFRNRKIRVIQDSRELYMIDKGNSIKSNFGTIIERMLMKRADYVICANEFRAEYVRKNIKLKNKPIVYENIRRLVSDASKKTDFEQKYKWLFEKNKPIVISTSGGLVERTNDKLVREFVAFDNKMILLLVGGETQEDNRVINAIIKEKKLNDVYILGRVSQNELQFLVSRSYIGIVNYGNYDFNNIYCASGKIYEFLYEGIPVVATSNPPLKDMCEKYGIGVSTDNYFDGIRRLCDNYSDYRKNVELFIQRDRIEENDKTLLDNMKMMLENMETKK